MRAVLFLIPANISKRKSAIPDSGEWRVRIRTKDVDHEARVIYEPGIEIFPGEHFFCEVKFLFDGVSVGKSFEVLEIGIVGIGVFLD